VRPDRAADSLWKICGTFPDVRNFVDPNWDPSERPPVADYLVRAHASIGCAGFHTCRFCSSNHGSAEADTTWRVERDQEHPSFIWRRCVKAFAKAAGSDEGGDPLGPPPWTSARYRRYSGLARVAKA